MVNDGGVLPLLLKLIDAITQNEQCVNGLRKALRTLIIPSLIATVSQETNEDARCLQFQVLSDTSKALLADSSNSCGELAPHLLQVCAKQFASSTQSLGPQSLKLMRAIFERYQIQSEAFDVWSFADVILREIQRDRGEIVNGNFFAVMFYLLVNASELIYVFQKDGLVELASAYLLGFENCDNYEEVLGFLNLSLEIIHKLAKTKQLD